MNPHDTTMNKDTLIIKDITHYDDDVWTCVHHILITIACGLRWVTCMCFINKFTWSNIFTFASGEHNTVMFIDCIAFNFSESETESN